MMTFKRKCNFYPSLFANILCAGDHREVILDLKTAVPCRCILQYIEPLGSQCVGKALKALYRVGGACANPIQKVLPHSVISTLLL